MEKTKFKLKVYHLNKDNPFHLNSALFIEIDGREYFLEKIQNIAFNVGVEGRYTDIRLNTYPEFIEVDAAHWLGCQDKVPSVLTSSHFNIGEKNDN